jgi:hypothetical protein
MSNPTAGPVEGLHRFPNTREATTLVAAGLLLLSSLAGRAAEGADLSQEAIVGDMGCAVLASGDSVRAAGATRSAATLQEVSWI